MSEVWQPIKTAPLNATEVILRVPVARGWPDHYQVIAHWASGGGEEQPPFRGWFRHNGFGFSEVSGEPTHWRPLSVVESV